MFMFIAVTNAQRETPVNKTRMAQLANSAVKQLRLRAAGTMAVTFIGAQRMRQLNRRALGHDRLTDVLTFRYDGEPVVGDILVAPAAARAYAAAHGLACEEELARYVVHGLLHWMGHEDRTSAQQQRMRSMEDRLLAECLRQ